MNAPHCRLCGKDHWAREGCQFAAVIKGSKHAIHVDGVKVPAGSIVLVSKRINLPAPAKRSGNKQALRDAMDGIGQPKNWPQKPNALPTPANRATAEKARPGKPKTAQRAKKKGKAK